MNIYVLPYKWKHNILGCVEAATLDEVLYVLSCSQDEHIYILSPIVEDSNYWMY